MKGYRQLAISLALTGWTVMMASNSNAEVYRWVDEQGRVQFSDKAPVNAEVQTLALPVVEERSATPELSDAERMARQKKLVKMLEEERLAKQEEKAQLALEAKEREQYCTRFKNRLSYVDQYTHFYDEKEDGTRQYMSDQEADAYRVRLKQQYKEECGGA
ncbi:DUF4124 domain-containing protein [Ketobacter alkanivorans]|uniref:DUF4124 domain-containing protein n=1 Tax=Ketobacter alkanivorans TaxID=1917421 RepID=A0A2K9LK47_9GAMM|nr:DUF4124 domain-containing protein [Ketobacter alkanivorans]AUM12607.1 hypothetical protein Kalk_09345 [Ketobacter alkanivorans]MCP5015022.1 DUF4124 domain-containing protein [Ketobacter sp.]